MIVSLYLGDIQNGFVGSGSDFSKRDWVCQVYYVCEDSCCTQGIHTFKVFSIGMKAGGGGLVDRAQKHRPALYWATALVAISNLDFHAGEGVQGEKRGWSLHPASSWFPC